MSGLAYTVIKRVSVLGLASGLLAGCAALGGSKAPTADTYELGLSQADDVAAVRAGTQILIAEPSALKALDSDNIVVRTEPLVIQYLDDAQWSDRLPKIVQRRLADTFTASDRFAGVGLPGQGLAIDYQLITEISAFSVDARANAANVVINAKLLDDRTGTVSASRQFRATVPAGGTTADAYVRALDAAFGTVSQDLVRWVADLI